jgi:hypothetical protein
VDIEFGVVEYIVILLMIVLFFLIRWEVLC